MVKTKEELEDWLLSKDREFIDSLREAHQDDIQGKGIDWEDLKEELGLWFRTFWIPAYAGMTQMGAKYHFLS
ncbi:MAG: hypothetical protein HQL61_06375, partial [Magnetococcales bacterium]|nr:hypothetical protein [Nitrospirota bacterium]